MGKSWKGGMKVNYGGQDSRLYLMGIMELLKDFDQVNKMFGKIYLDTIVQAGNILLFQKMDHGYPVALCGIIWLCLLCYQAEHGSYHRVS